MKTRAWRLVKRKLLRSAFSGEGAAEYGGRWNSAGTRVVYAAESLSLAVLEILAGGADLSLLDLYVKIPADFDDAAVTILEAPPQGWKSSPPGYATQAIGDRWVREGSGVILRVPSVVVDGEYNFLINPQHPLFPRTVTVGTPAVFRFDPRLG